MSDEHACTPDVRRSRRRPRRLGQLLSVVTLTLAVSGCSAGDDLLRVLRGLADDTDTLANSVWRPKNYTLPPPAQWPTEQQIADEAARLATPVSNVPPEGQQVAVRYACESADVMEAWGGTPSEAVEYVVTRTSTPYSYRLQVKQLAVDLVEAGSATEQAVVLGRITLCTWASS